MRMDELIPSETITSRILLIRGEKVLLDSDLAILYGVETKALNRAVRRNHWRFPEDFVFQLTEEEDEFLRCQFGTSKKKGGRRYLPHVFTEQGVAMLSGVLNSKRAALVNVAIMRAFVRLRRLVASNKSLAQKLVELEQQVSIHNTHIKSLFNAIRQLMEPPVTPRRPIGFIK